MRADQRFLRACGVRPPDVQDGHFSAEVRRFDFERMECPACGERFVPVPSQPGVLSLLRQLSRLRYLVEATTTNL
jgi:hypothetical protein